MLQNTAVWHFTDPSADTTSWEKASGKLMLAKLLRRGLMGRDLCVCAYAYVYIYIYIQNSNFGRDGKVEQRSNRLTRGSNCGKKELKSRIKEVGEHNPPTNLESPSLETTICRSLVPSCTLTYTAGPGVIQDATTSEKAMLSMRTGQESLGEVQNGLAALRRRYRTYHVTTTL